MYRRGRRYYGELPLIETLKGDAMIPVPNDPALQFTSQLNAIKDQLGAGPARSEIYKAIPEIMKEVGHIGKEGRNRAQGYDFRGIDQAYKVIQPIMAKHKVFNIPRILEKNYEELKSKSGGNLTYCRITMEYRFYAHDGSSICVVVPGEAMDSSDKATNKALSAAHKYALFQTFMPPTEPGNIEDGDKDHPEPTGKKPGTISKDQVKRLFTIATAKYCPDHEVKKIIESFDYTSTKDIKIKDYDKIIDLVETFGKPVNSETQ